MSGRPISPRPLQAGSTVTSRGVYGVSAVAPLTAFIEQACGVYHSELSSATLQPATLQTSYRRSSHGSFSAVFEVA